MPQRDKVLITGSSGMLGRDLWQELEGDYELYGMDIAASRDIRGPYFECDIGDRKAVKAAISQLRPDVVIHLAAWTDVDGCELAGKKAYSINAEGAKNVALACKDADSMLIYISTDFVFDGKKKRPYRETDRTNPLSIYGDSKLKGEEAVRKILKRYFIVRTSWLYGRRGKNFVDRILQKAKASKVLKVVDDQVGSPTYTRDLAKAIHALLDKVSCQLSAVSCQRYGIYHVSNAGSVSWYQYAKEILMLTGSKTKVLPISSKELNRPARRPAMSILDNSKFINFTGYRMRNWKTALKEYIKKEKGRAGICR